MYNLQTRALVCLVWGLYSSIIHRRLCVALLNELRARTIPHEFAYVSPKQKNFSIQSDTSKPETKQFVVVFLHVPSTGIANIAFLSTLIKTAETKLAKSSGIIHFEMDLCRSFQRGSGLDLKILDNTFYNASSKIVYLTLKSSRFVLKTILDVLESKEHNSSCVSTAPRMHSKVLLFIL